MTEKQQRLAQVKKHVNEVAAQVVAWSLKHAARGVAPLTGFYGEEFAPNSHRGQMAGKQLAGGHRTGY